MKFVNLKIVLFSLALVAGPLGAIEIDPEMRAIMKQLEIAEGDIKESPVQGLYEVQVGTQIYYLSRGGKYLLTGDMIDMKTRENLTERRLGSIRATAIGTVEEDQLISFKAGQPEHTVTVFTDIDCGYCRKLHSQMADYNRLGITVNYLFYPRAGIGSSSYQSAVSVWCTKDRHEALTLAKSGKSLPRGNCENPVARHFKLGNALEISGTPAIVTQSGHLLPGYVPPSMLKKRLDEMGKQAIASQQVSRNSR